ncbi:MAG: DUF1501 domain-containing protein, partial [Hyphomicrobiales bacterium]|nr:DUF1501 domain-containing protein [Hyphomicrobiales bacterium]
MLVITNREGANAARKVVGLSRRDVLRIGGSSLLGLSLADVLRQRTALAASVGRRGFGAARSVIMVYLQGGPSHLDLWDPK